MPIYNYKCNDEKCGEETDDIIYQYNSLIKYLENNLRGLKEKRDNLVKEEEDRDFIGLVPIKREGAFYKEFEDVEN